MGDPHRTSGRRVAATAVAAAALLLSGVVAHDLVASMALNKGWLCERADGSLWRDASSGCTSAEDPECLNGVCSDSRHLAEGWRHSCAWLLFKEQWPPSGTPPYYAGPAPGAGCPGRTP